MTPRVLSIIFATIFATQASYAGNGNDNQNSETWQLPGDILGASNQISFNQGAKDVWYFMQSNTLDQKESSYSLLTGYTTPCTEVGIDGLLCWYPSLPYDFSTGFPWIGLNVTAATQFPKTVTWPAQTLAMHPAPDKLAIVAWRSPISQKIDIKGSFIDLDAVCGNGVKWFINKGKNTLAGGVLLNGGKASFNLTKVQINQGEVLYFIVNPNYNDYLCDTTGLKVTIK